jgi:hypothetical protein
MARRASRGRGESIQLFQQIAEELDPSLRWDDGLFRGSLESRSDAAFFSTYFESELRHLVGEVRWAGSPSGLMVMDGQESQARSATGEGLGIEDAAGFDLTLSPTLSHQRGRGLNRRIPCVAARYACVRAWRHDQCSTRRLLLSMKELLASTDYLPPTLAFLASVHGHLSMVHADARSFA